MSVSPYKENLEVCEVSDDEGEMPQEVCERVGVEDSDKVFKRLIDPKLPSQEEVDMHYIRGHLPYRNWCPEWVIAKVRDLDHR